MGKTFNTDGYCDSELNYMVDLTERLKEIKIMVDDGKYFSINRARQYGKTTVLTALSDYLKEDYDVISLDFQGLSYGDFESEQSFVAAFSRQMLLYAEHIPVDVEKELNRYASGQTREVTLSALFVTLLKICRKDGKGVVLIIDEVDSASNNQVFVDFLAQLRLYYLRRRKLPVFQSVILAGVYDVRNIRRKIRPDEEHKENSPWNIAADFLVEMSFSTEDIEGMLEEYEADCHTGMNIRQIATLLYDYTSGYPYLVSRLCKLMDERIAGKEGFSNKSDVWTSAGCLMAVKMLLDENNPLFDSMINKLNQFQELNEVIRRQLFQGHPVAYAADDTSVRIARMFGIVSGKW